MDEHAQEHQALVDADKTQTEFMATQNQINEKLRESADNLSAMVDRLTDAVVELKQRVAALEAGQG